MDEVKQNISHVYVWGEVFDPNGMAMLLHLAMHDVSGKSIVIYVKGEACLSSLKKLADILTFAQALHVLCSFQPGFLSVFTCPLTLTFP